MKSNKKLSNVKESKQNHPISGIKCTYFLIRPLEARAEILTNIVGFVVNLKRLKGHFEIN